MMKAATRPTWPALLAFEHPTVGSMLKGSGVGAPSSMHCMKSPSLQPSARIQSAVDVAAVIRITVMKQHVKAITLSGLVTVMVSMVTCGAPILPTAGSLQPCKEPSGDGQKSLTL